MCFTVSCSVQAKYGATACLLLPLPIVEVPGCLHLVMQMLNVVKCNLTKSAYVALVYAAGFRGLLD